jgi:hypothetical protein
MRENLKETYMPYGLPHPEAKDGEVWMANLTEHSFAQSAFKTKRRGIQAYTIKDKPMHATSGLAPMFVQLSEAEELQIPVPDQTGKSLGRLAKEVE